MKFFTFSQNNSGGVFADPAQYVIVQADDAFHANVIAVTIGLYFHGVSKGRDCDCCGDRWHTCCDTDGDDTPQIYGKDVADFKPSGSRSIFRSLSNSDTQLAVVYYKNGDVQNFA